MLDNTTKKNIDDCRDVLVGKVPDPKSQIEQITLALIYKFMDDMDREAVEKFKGKAKFFTGKYAKYGWRKLFDPSLAGKDMLDLYSEALDNLQINPNVPELFRNIFKNAYLPYRDPSTLKLFLKHINQFEYSHSEKLGDAFEYLLSVMGSQGDAGQFRTPRHIIDFVTACVNPQKGETVLDPACGTAGFLLSAYKHILNQNTDKRQGDKLKPDDRKKLATNFVGYDISPDMVRLSLANMYLHGFTTPQIHEYDTLSNEDRWQETYDVILANPPFMTPKGGIRPHKKFGVQATKAEVLFTDYIAEHLNSKGRAGIIVPNGIVATSQTAYKELRKHLVNDSLIAVISLPAGVFQPYSGVKTSILILDKQLAKKSKDILFLKIENDGFDLGSQRREHDKNDLPLVLKTITDFKESFLTSTPFTNLPTLGTLVEKQTLLENKDVVLNPDRYLLNNKVLSDFNLVKIEDICTVVRGSSPRPQGDPKFYGGSIPRLMIADVTRDGMYSTPKIDFLTEKGALKSRPMKKGEVIMAVSGNPGLTTILAVDACIHDGFVGFRNLSENVLPQFLFQTLNFIKDENNKKADGAVFRNLTTDQIKNFEIPLPPLEIQQQIVSEIEGYQNIIDGAKQVVTNYKPVINIDPEWDFVALGEVCDVRDGTHDSPKYHQEGYPLVTSKNLKNGIIDFTSVNYISKEDLVKINKRSNVDDGDILMPMIGTIGNPIIVHKEREFSVKNVALIKPKQNSRVLQYFVNLILQTPLFETYISSQSKGSTQKFLSLGTIREFKIPVPNLEKQNKIIDSIKKEILLVKSNETLIELFEAKIKRKIAKVWGMKKVYPDTNDAKSPMSSEEKSNFKTKQKRNASIA